MSEQTIMKEVMLAVGKHFPKITKLFRNNVGMGWTGSSKSYPDSVVIKNARPLHAGLCKGSSDLIGWTEKVITADMVGQSVAIFTAIEVKGSYGRVSKEQKHFLETVANAGGIAGLARNEQDLVRLIGNRLNLQ